MLLHLHRPRPPLDRFVELVTYYAGYQPDHTKERLLPDGRYLAYDGAGEDHNYDIYLRDMETGETVRLTNRPTYEQGPVFISVIQ